MAILTVMIGLFIQTSAQGGVPMISSGPGSGAHEPAPGGRDACWSEPGDLEGMLASSEIISTLGLESEIANDFMVDGAIITRAIWWGGQYGTTQCWPEWPTPGFNLRFYEDDDCRPGTMFAELVVSHFTEEFLGCGPGGNSPFYRYSTDISIPVTPGARYWFSAQFRDHPYPFGQGGRLTTVSVTGCMSVFKSAFFGFPDWAPADEVFGGSYDFGQEFECGVTSTREVSWSRIRALYR